MKAMTSQKSHWLFEDRVSFTHLTPVSPTAVTAAAVSKLEQFLSLHVALVNYAV